MEEGIRYGMTIFAACLVLYGPTVASKHLKRDEEITIFVKLALCLSGVKLSSGKLGLVFRVIKTGRYFEKSEILERADTIEGWLKFLCRVIIAAIYVYTLTIL